MGPDGTLLPHQPGRSTRVLDWRAPVGRDSTKRSGLLIRGFGVRVPGGALLIKALTWWFSPDRSHFHVYCGRLGARGVLWSRWTKPAPMGPDGLDSMILRRPRRGCTGPMTEPRQCAPHTRPAARCAREVRGLQFATIGFTGRV